MQFALKLTWRVVAIADVADFLVHILLDVFGLLPYPLSQALVVGLIATTVIGATVGFLFNFITGDAIRKIAIDRKEFERLSKTDPLTGLLNRLAIVDIAGRDWNSVGTLILFDIDHFKRVNDSYGHAAGDLVICEVAATIVKQFEGLTSLCARIGGEEFCAFVPGNDYGLVEHAAESIRAAIECTSFDYDGTAISVTVSGGLHSARDAETIETVYRKADEALYASKANGRNRITVSTNVDAASGSVDKDMRKTG